MSTNIVILGGGFGGVYTALELERRFKNRSNVEITLVNRENFLLFTPMLHEIAASDLDATDIVNPIHKLLRKVKFFCGRVDQIDLSARQVTVSHGDTHHSHVLKYDHLVLSLGSITHFYGLPGLEENALTMKSLGDAIHLRNRMIGLLEEADFECCKDVRSRLLTFVVAGGGFAGVETVAAINDFLHSILPYYSNLKPEDIKVILVNSGKVILPELSEKLGRYAGEILEGRGVKIHYGTKVLGFTDHIVKIGDGASYEACTLVWTAGTAPNPLLSELTCTKEKGRVVVSDTLQLAQWPGVWAVGDCAAIPDPNGGYYPPTAQHAIREAKIVANNIILSMDGKRLKPFRFKTLGQLASLGHRKGVAQILGMRFSGFIAWWLWRSIYLMKLPRLEKRVRVALSWALDLVFSKDNVQLPTERSPRDVMVSLESRNSTFEVTNKTNGTMLNVNP